MLSPGMIPYRDYARGRSSGAEQGPFKPRVEGSNPSGLTQSGFVAIVHRSQQEDLPMQLAAALTEFGYAKDHSAESRRWYKSRLGAFICWGEEQGVTNIEDITTALVRRYVDYRRNTPANHGQPLDSHTLHGHVRAIRALLYWAAEDDLLDRQVPKRVKLPTKEQKLLAVFTPQQLDRLMRACDSNETPQRDKAMLAVLLDTGIRAAELCTLTLGDVTFTPDDAYLLVHGKGRKQREVPLGRTSRRLLHAYIHRVRPTVEEQHVFLAKGGGALTPNGLDQLLYRTRRRAGAGHFTGVRVSAHTFRHTYAVRSLEAGTDIYKLSRLMGHSTVATTEGYLKAFTSRAARQGGVSVLDALSSKRC
jgi:site-specific recombinase XerD